MKWDIRLEGYDRDEANFINQVLGSSDIEKRLEDYKGKLYAAVKLEIKSGSDSYTPKREGDLMDSAKPSAADETPLLVYNEPYAAYQYYAGDKNRKEDFKGRNKNNNEQAQWKWIEAYLNSLGSNPIQHIVDKAIKNLKL